MANTGNTMKIMAGGMMKIMDTTKATMTEHQSEFSIRCHACAALDDPARPDESEVFGSGGVEMVAAFKFDLEGFAENAERAD